MRRRYVASTLGILAAAAARVTSGQTLPATVYDPFNYPSGDLNGHGLWTEKVANGVPIDSTVNLSYTGLNPSAIGAASLTGSSSSTNGEKMQTNFVGAPSNFGSIYFSLLVQVNSISTLPTGGEGAFFTGFNNVHTSSGLTNGAMFVRIRPDPSNTANYEFGVAKSTSTGNNVAWETDANSHAVTGQTALLVGKFTATGAGNTVQLWVNPTASSFGLSEADAPTPTLSTSLGADVVADDFFLKASTNQGQMYADDARVGNTWASVAPIVWSNGAGDNTWVSSSNWYSGATPNAAGVTPTFADVAGVSRTVHVSQPETVGGIIFNSSTGYTIDSTGGALTFDTNDPNTAITSSLGNHTISAPITLNKNLVATISANNVTLSGGVNGNASITKAGNGTLTLSGTNGYSGTTTINAGTLTTTNAAALPGSATPGQISVAAGAVLNVVAGGATEYSDSDLATLISNANFASGAKLSVSVDSGNTATDSSNITGSPALIKNGPGTLVLAGNNSYTGGTTISGGALRVTDDSNFGAAPGGLADNIVLDGGTLQLSNNAGINANRIIDITSNGGTIDTDANQTNSYGSSLAFRLPLGAGTGGPLTKIGAGTFNYEGGYQGSYTSLTVMGGTFQFGKADELPAGTVTLNGGAVRVLLGFSAGNPLSVGANNGTFDTSSSDVTLSGSVTGTGTLHKTGGSKLITNGVQLGGLSVDQGAVFTSPGRNAAKLSKLGSLAVASGAAMDVYDNDLIIDYPGSSPDPSQLSSAQALIKRGYANGHWNGDGLTSSQAQNFAGSAHPTALGFAEASTVSSAIGGTFDGASLDNSMILVRYTYFGDANLDGSVDSNDFALLAANYGKTGQFWNAGDFNYDGTVNALDFNLLATNYGQLESATLPDEAAPALGALVPEPGSITLLATFGILNCRRRRSA